MDDFLRVIEALPPKLDRLHLTIVADGRASTFASDNADDLLPFALVQAAKIRNPERKQYKVVMICRRFTEARDATTRLPIKHVSACVFARDGVVALSAEERPQSTSRARGST